MQDIVPLIIICCVGIALCVAYMIYQLVKMKKNGVRFRKDKREEFEINEDVLTIQLDDKK